MRGAAVLLWRPRYTSSTPFLLLNTYLSPLLSLLPPSLTTLSLSLSLFLLSHLFEASHDILGELNVLEHAFQLAGKVRATFFVGRKALRPREKEGKKENREKQGERTDERRVDGQM